MYSLYCTCSNGVKSSDLCGTCYPSWGGNVRLNSPLTKPLFVCLDCCISVLKVTYKSCPTAPQLQSLIVQSQSQRRGKRQARAICRCLHHPNNSLIFPSEVPGPAHPAEKAKTDVKERCVPSFLCYFRSQRPVNTVPGPALYQQPPCRRCQASGTPCIFEKPEKKNAQGLSTASVEYALSFACHHHYVSCVYRRRLSRLEGQYLVLPATLI